MGVGGAGLTGDDNSSDEEDNAEVDLLAAACCWWCMCNIDSMLNFLAALVSASRRRDAAVLCPLDAVPDPAVLVVSAGGRLEGGEEAADGKAIEFIPAGNNRRGAGKFGG